MTSKAVRSGRTTVPGTAAAPRGVMAPMRSAQPPSVRRTAVSVVALGIVVLAVTACAADMAADPSGGSDRPPRSEGPGEPTSTPSSGSAVGDVPATIVAAILDDAAERSGVAHEELVVSRAVAMTFSDGSLDCPEPGMAYTQALVDGYQVEIVAGGETLDYRVGTGGSFRLCEAAGPPAGG